MRCVLFGGEVKRDTLHCTAMQCNAGQLYTVKCCTIQYSTIQYTSVQCSALPLSRECFWKLETGNCQITERGERGGMGRGVGGGGRGRGVWEERKACSVGAQKLVLLFIDSSGRLDTFRRLLRRLDFGIVLTLIEDTGHILIN